MMVGGRQDENDSGKMLWQVWRIKGECMDRIGGDYPLFKDLLARKRIDRWNDSRDDLRKFDKVRRRMS
jgi:hypothetical protein